ncbi:MAG: energy transducer TonB [Thalassotalea sp.]
MFSFTKITKRIFAVFLVLSITLPSSAQVNEEISQYLTTIEKPKPLKRVSPQYPISAAKTKREGWAIFNFTIEPDGSVSNIQLEESFGSKAFAVEARKAIKEWEYKPAFENGKPIQQCVNSVQFDFMMKGVESGITRGFKKSYKRIIAFLQENELEKAKEELEKFNIHKMHNIRESNYMNTLWIEYAKKINNEKLQLTHLKKIMFKGQKESPNYKLGVLNELLVLEIKFKRFKDAFRTHRELKKLEVASSHFKTYQRIINNVKDIILGTDIIAIDANIEREDYWRHHLVRNEFSITNMQGSLHKIEVRCANKRHIYTIEENSTWKIPTQWKHCSIDVYGANNATFTLIEHPFESALLKKSSQQASE